MIETKAVFKGKDTKIEAKDCVVDKVIRISGAMFDLFSKNLTREWDFIRDNFIDTVVDKQGRYHCLLVTGEGRSDGILVNSEGAGYARYSAFMPNAEALVMAERYPYLMGRTRQLVAAADYIVALVSDGSERAEANEPYSYAVSFHALSEKFGIPFAPYDSQTNLFMAMLSDRPEIALVRHNAEAFLINAAPPEPAIADAPMTEAVAGARNDTEREFEAWQYRVDENGAGWREDKRYRQHKDGSLYYVGGESGQYMRIAKDGRLTVGDYELARPSIEEAALVIHATKQYGSYEQATFVAYQLAGTRFTDEIFNRKPSVIKQIRGSRDASKQPGRKDSPEQKRHKGEPEI